MFLYKVCVNEINFFLFSVDSTMNKYVNVCQTAMFLYMFRVKEI